MISESSIAEGEMRRKSLRIESHALLSRGEDGIRVASHGQ